MSRRAGLIALALAVIALSAVLAAVDPSTEDDGNPSILEFEFAWTEESAEEIRAEWGEEGEDAARLSLWIDFAYLLAYGGFGILAVAATRDFAAGRGLRRLAALGSVASAAAIAAPLCDAVEDVWLLIALGGAGGDLAPLLAGAFASVKFAALAAGIAYLLAGLVARLRPNRTGADPA
ncbi:MAG: hypothetical protein ACRDKH_06460 [Solirubrobacterales bacterium]